MKRLIDTFGNNLCVTLIVAGAMACLLAVVYLTTILASFCSEAYSTHSTTSILPFWPIVNTNAPTTNLNAPIGHYDGYDIPRDTTHGTVIRVALEQGLIPTDCKATFESVSPQVVRDAIGVGLLPAFSLADEFMTPIPSPADDFMTPIPSPEDDFMTPIPSPSHNPSDHPSQDTMASLSEEEIATNKGTFWKWTRIGFGGFCAVYIPYHHYSVQGNWGIF
ncbi:hypothetical protein BJ875DRAFT_455459 [Amylocarpus encephaloides]|uniref:Uncharacterized protein n=1 Tax=Amylocarpus encephaloides TaxID=45428 RepID=A0A9P7YN97_9HELO|nr:hypothetical protein BJ875DRAFT_455459 [Amylocarpus encephaloides]